MNNHQPFELLLLALLSTPPNIFSFAAFTLMMEKIYNKKKRIILAGKCFLPLGMWKRGEAVAKLLVQAFGPAGG